MEAELYPPVAPSTGQVERRSDNSGFARTVGRTSGGRAGKRVCSVTKWWWSAEMNMERTLPGRRAIS
jgi:hypothetical protein